MLNFTSSEFGDFDQKYTTEKVIFLKWTLNFLKGTSAHRNTKVKISKKVWVGWKNDKYVFSSWKWDLSDANNFSQQKLTFCCLQSQFYKKFAKKSLKIIIWVKGWGALWILVFWPLYYFEMKFKVSFQLPVNRFFICWVFNFWALGEIWQNLDFGQISLLFYVWNIVYYKIVLHL